MSSGIAIFGAGLSGRAAMRLAKVKGYEPALFDEAGEGSLAVFDESKVAKFDRFVFSPGFAAKHPWRVLAEQSGRSVQSELGFAAEHWNGQLIGVTGTNGKTTLTNFLTGALQRAGKNAVAAGNVGRPLSDIVLCNDQVGPTCAVCEISSFQAELVEGLELDALLWTNFAEDHLDRYATMRDYFLAKAGLLKCLKQEAVCILGPQVVPWFDLFEQPVSHATIAFADTALINRLKQDSVFSRPPFTEDFSLAAEYWRLTNQSEQVLLESANEFILAPHRLDVVAEKDGVTYWNDSKSTNFHSTIAALDAIGRPNVWIGGGRAKGGNLEAFAKELSCRVDAAILYGEAATRMADALSGQLDKVHVLASFEDSVSAASDLACELGFSNVLLSPGFSSFDQFKSFEERGKTFISLVLGL